MKYDPIMCMMVPDTVKTKDESYVVRGKKYKVVKRDGDNVTVLGTDGKVTKMNINFLMSEGTKTKDSNAIDKAIRNCDVNKEEGFKIYNATVRNDTLYIEYEDLLYGRGKKEKESFTRTEAKKLLNDPWNTWLGTSKMVVKQFAG